METCAIPSEPLSSWEDYKSLISTNLHPVRDRFLFRGQSDTTWTLRTTFERTFAETPEDKREEILQKLLESFRRECEHYPEYRDLVKQEVLCLALAQHHGLPTPLLDWTESPYTAAYFAFQGHLERDGDPEKCVAIWVLNRTVERCWSGKNGVSLISPDTWNNERLRRQSGWFTYAQMPFSSLEEYVCQMKNVGNALRKFILPAGEAKKALSDLDLMGISARHLFADLAGAARNAYVRTVLHYASTKKL
jgi:hypothetical protein